MLSICGLIDRARVIVEKPFGTDLASARKLNKIVHEILREERIFRTDHRACSPPIPGSVATGPTTSPSTSASPRGSRSFCGKRPGLGMVLDKANMQFSLDETDYRSDTLEAYERLVRDAMAGDHLVHDGEGHRAPLGSVGAAARGRVSCPALPGRIVGRRRSIS